MEKKYCMEKIISITAILVLSLGGWGCKKSTISPYAGQKVAPVPPGWRPPPPIGTKGYMGPPPSAPMRMSPYSAPTSKGVRRQRRLKRTSDQPFKKELAKFMQDRKGKILFIYKKGFRENFGDLEKRIVYYDDKKVKESAVMLSKPAGQDDSEKALAKYLEDKGVKYVLIDRYVIHTVGWLDDNADQILHRMSWGWPLRRFHPKLLGRTFLLYVIAPPFILNQHDGQAMVDYARAALSGNRIELKTSPILDHAGGNEDIEVAISLRKFSATRIPGSVKRGINKKTGKPRYRRAGLHGRRIIIRWASGTNLKDALDRAVTGLKRGWKTRRKNAKTRYGVDLAEDLAQAISGMEIELDVVYDKARITDRTERRLHEAIEMGVDGIFLEYMKNGHLRRYKLPPAYPIQRLDYGDKWKLKGPVILARHLSQAWAKLAPDAWKDDNVTFGRFRTRSFLEAEPGGKVVSTYRGTPLIYLHQVTRNNLINALKLGCNYLVRNQLPDGQFRYKYWAHRDRWVRGNNIVRHALNPYTVLMAEQFAPDPKWTASAKKGIDYTLHHMKCEGQEDSRICYIWHKDTPAKYENAKVGTVAVTILSMLRLNDFEKLTTGYRDTLRSLGNFLVYIQDPNGHFRQYYVPADHPYYGCTNAIFPGEIMFALSRLYSYFKDDRFKTAFEKAFRYYKEWWKLQKAKEQKDGTYTEEERADMVGFVPWQCMAMEDAYGWSKDKKYADFALELQLWMDGHFLYTPMRSAYPDYLGASFKFHGEQPAINSCGYTEGCAATYSIAKRTGTNRPLLRDHLLWGLRFAMQLQYRDIKTTAYFLPNPAVVLGGFRYCLNRLRLRNDYSYHALSAIYQGLKFLDPGDYAYAKDPGMMFPDSQK
ncbi:MAG: hypothetical protein GXP49_14815 [Deltaproteobacteria bacterium]|nr:hypothetical protein [Deltaproteobacteria bacterium]